MNGRAHLSYLVLKWLIIPTMVIDAGWLVKSMINVLKITCGNVSVN